MKKKLEQSMIVVLAMLCLLIVSAAPISASTHKVLVGKEITLSFKSITPKNVSWSVQDTNILRLKSTGQSSITVGNYSEISYNSTFLGLAAGTTSVFAYDESGNLLASAEVSVEKPLYNFELDFDCLFLSYGESFQLQPVSIPEGVSLIWSSDNSNASVDQNGIVSLVFPFGTSKVTCRTSDGLYSAECTIIGDSPTYYPDLWLTVGDSARLTYSVNVHDDIPELHGTYSSSNPSIVSVDKNGIVYAKSSGTATISAKIGNKVLRYSVSSVSPEPVITPTPTNTPIPTPSESDMTVSINYSEWLSTNKLQLTGISNKNGSAYIKVVKKSSDAPSADQIIADSQETSVSANTAFKIAHTFTADEKAAFEDNAVTAYICVKDAKNGDTVVKSIDMNMTARPARLKGISASWTSHNSAKITCQSNKYGVCYWGWAERGEAVLSFEKCQKSDKVVANKNFALTVDNITSDNAIDVYIYIKGNNGGISTPLVAKLSQSTRPQKPHTHNKETATTKATTRKNGTIITKCSECGKVFSQEVIHYPKTISLSANSYTYNGKVQKPGVSVKGSDGKVIASANYSLSYSKGRKNAGTYKVKITFKGNYSGSATKSFAIKKASQAISAANKTKTLGAKTFALNAKRTKGNGKLTYKSSNTKVAAISNTGQVTIKGVGKTTITITATATTNYNNVTKKVTITVNPKGTSLTGLKNSGAKKIVVQWKRNKAITGYQIRYSTSSSFKGVKTVTVKKNSTLKTTISKLVKGKTYYTQIRTYKTVSGKNYYSGWSNTKKVKITK